jgi:PqqA peptide cyclase
VAPEIRLALLPAADELLHLPKIAYGVLATMGEPSPHPLELLAELTHRCPLGCPYCSNPIALESRADELDTLTWASVFAEAVDLGVHQVHLSGGEPTARRDIVEITAAAHRAGLYTNLITSAVGVTEKTLAALAEAGLDHIQISVRDANAVSADRIAGYDGAYVRKRALAAAVVRLGIPLTVNAAIHRANIDRIAAMVDQCRSALAGSKLPMFSITAGLLRTARS